MAWSESKDLSLGDSIHQFPGVPKPPPVSEAVAAGHNLTMQQQTNHTNEIDLGDEQTEHLLTLLGLIEDAETRQDAVWLDESGRAKVTKIRERIEAQTGRK